MQTRVTGFKLDPCDHRTWELLHTLNLLPPLSEELRECIRGWLHNASLYNAPPPREDLDTRLLQVLDKAHGFYLEPSANQGDGVVYLVKLLGRDINTNITAAQHSNRPGPTLDIEFREDDPAKIKRFASALGLPQDLFTLYRDHGGRESVMYWSHHGVVSVVYSA